MIETENNIRLETTKYLELDIKAKRNHNADDIDDINVSAIKS